METACCDDHDLTVPPAGGAPSVSGGLPGWTYVAQPSPRPRKRSHRFQDRTQEQYLEVLAAATEECKQEVAGSAVFSRLRAALDACLGREPARHAGVAGGDDDDELPGTSGAALGPGSLRSSPSTAGGGYAGILQLVIYGLGSLQHSRVSRYQAALGLLLADMLPALSRPPQAYDPAFTELDVALLTRLGVDVIAHNEEGRRRISEPTLFFLPHCEVGGFVLGLPNCI